jgi:ABC-type transport system involved in multi-copper enzyme maturation permease subunit
MRHLLAIARRDLTERTFVFLTAVVLAVLPLILPRQMMGVRSFSYTDVVTTIGAIVAVGFTLGLALVLGVTMIGRDLSEKRLSFYFSKPLSASAIWFGKLGAAIVTLAVCFTVLFFPSYLVGTTSWHRSWNVELPVAFAIVGGAALVLLLFGHVFGTMFRSKSPLVVLDLALMVAAVFAAIEIIGPLLEGFAGDLATRVTFVLFGALMLILLACGAWQLAHGRADRKQNHFALSRFLWVSLAIVLVVAGLFTAWVVNVSPNDMKSVDVTQPQQGTWGFLFGETKHRMDYHALFVYDLATGNAVRLHGIRSWFSSGFSRDGRTIAYLKLPDYRAPEGELYTMQLGANATPQDTRITLSRGSEFAFSDDSARIATIDGNGVATVYQLASKKALGSVRVPQVARTRRRFFFVNPDLLRIYIQFPQYPTLNVAEHGIDIYEFDLRTRTLAHTAQLRMQAKRTGMTVSPDGTRALILIDNDSSSSARLVDARTGALISEAPAAGLMHTTLLADGSVALLTKNGAQEWTFDTNGRQIPLGKAQQMFFVRELAGGRMVIKGGDRDSTQLYVVDYVHGSVLRTEPNLYANGLSNEQWWNTDPRRLVADATQPLAATAKGTLYAWQPVSGEKKELFRF